MGETRDCKRTNKEDTSAGKKKVLRRNSGSSRGCRTAKRNDCACQVTTGISCICSVCKSKYCTENREKNGFTVVELILCGFMKTVLNMKMIFFFFCNECKEL